RIGTACSMRSRSDSDPIRIRTLRIAAHPSRGSESRTAVPLAAGAAVIAFAYQGVVLVPACRLEARVRAQPPHLGLGHDEVRARRADHVLLDHQRPEVVRAEAQCELRHLR